MTTYYIDPTVGGPGSGTIGDPWSSWSSVTWAAGNSYLQKAGTTSSDKVAPNVGGTASAPIIIGAYNVTAAAPYATLNHSATNYVVEFGTGLSYFVLQDMEITGGKDNSLVSCPASPKCSHITIQRCLVHDIVDDAHATDTNNGISLNCDNLVVRDTIVYNMPDDGIWVNGNDPTFINCTVYNVGQNATRFSGDAIQTANTTGQIIYQNCYLECTRDKSCAQSPNPGANLLIVDCYMYGGSWVINTQCKNVQIYRSILIGNDLAEATPNGIYASTPQAHGHTWDVAACVLDCGGWGSLGFYVNGGSYDMSGQFNNCVFLNNKSQNYYAMIHITANTATWEANNCVIQSGATGTWSFISADATQTITLRNNIFNNEYSSFVLLNNTSYSTISAFQSAGFGSGNTKGTTVFDADYRITSSGQSYIGAGVKRKQVRALDRIEMEDPPWIGAYGAALSRSAASARTAASARSSAAARLPTMAAER